DVLHVGSEIAGFPVVVVSVVLHLIEPEVLPGQHLAQIFQCSRLEKELVPTGGAVIERDAYLGRQCGILLGFERTVKAEIRRQHKGAAMICVVAHEKVGHGRLRRRSLERRMRINDAGRCEESGIRNPPDSGFAVVVGNVFQQPVNAVIGVTAVVDVFVGFLLVDVRPHLGEGSFRHVSATHVLKHKDVAGFVELKRGTKLLTVLIDTIGGDAVRSAVEEKWIRTGAVFGNVDSSEQMNPVAHGNAVFVFRVMFLYIVSRLIGFVLTGKGRKQDEYKRKNDQGIGRSHSRPHRNRQPTCGRARPSSKPLRRLYNNQCADPRWMRTSARGSMFEVTVEDSFAAGHYLRDYKGKCENPHGHNYKVRVTLAGMELDKAGLLLDFKDLREVMKYVIDRLDHQMINDIEPFKTLNPSAENLAKYFYDEANQKLARVSNGRVRVRNVTIFETDTTTATYSE